MNDVLIELVGPCGRVPTALAEVPLRLSAGWEFAHDAAEQAFLDATKFIHAPTVIEPEPPRDETGS